MDAAEDQLKKGINAVVGVRSVDQALVPSINRLRWMQLKIS